MHCFETVTLRVKSIGERMLTIHKCFVKFQSCTPAELQQSLSECSKCKWSLVTACLISLHVISKYLGYGLCLIVLLWELYLTTETSVVLTGLFELWKRTWPDNTEN